MMRRRKNEKSVCTPTKFANKTMTRLDNTVITI